MADPASLAANDSFNIGLRLAFALGIGSIVGWIRQAERKAAGLRTHMLVTVTAALLVSIPLQLVTREPEGAVTFVLQGISTGVGFLGAGVILRQSDPAQRRLTVKGLTSASEIWVSAALGAGAGCGLWLSSSIGTVLLIFILTVVKRIERSIPVKIDEEVS